MLTCCRRQRADSIPRYGNLLEHLRVRYTGFNNAFARRRKAVGDLRSGVPILVTSDDDPLHEQAHKLAPALEGFRRVSFNFFEVVRKLAQPHLSVLCGESLLLAGCKVGLDGLDQQAQILDSVPHVGQGDLKLCFTQSAFRIGADQARLLLFGGCDLLAERGVALFQVSVVLLALKLNPYALQDLARIREEPPYVRPDDSLKPVARDSRTVEFHSSPLVTLLPACAGVLVVAVGARLSRKTDVFDSAPFADNKPAKKVIADAVAA